MWQFIHIPPYLQDAEHRAVNIGARVKGLPMPIGANRRATAYITHHLLREKLSVLRLHTRQATQKRLRLTIYYIELSYSINLWAGIHFARIIFNYFVAGLGFCCRWLGVLLFPRCSQFHYNADQSLSYSFPRLLNLSSRH